MCALSWAGIVSRQFGPGVALRSLSALVGRVESSPEGKMRVQNILFEYLQ
jgi:hypothetical protein